MSRRIAAGGASLVGLACANYLGEVLFRDDPQSLVEAARQLRISRRPPAMTKQQLASLAKDGFVEVPGFLAPAHVKAARAECTSMYAAGEFAPPIGGEAVRTDSVHWLGARAAQPALAAALAELRALPASMMTGFNGFEAERRHDGSLPPRDPLGVPRTAQLARYAPAAEQEACDGGRYRPHRDAPPSPRALLLPGIYMRQLTAVLYLSPTADEWTARGAKRGAAAHSETAASGHPGSLMLYLDAAPTDSTGVSAHRVVEVRPVGGTLVLFDARRVLHEVLPHGACDAERLAVTVWMGGAHRGSSVGEVVRGSWRTLGGNVYEWAKTMIV
jgi:hypothetical protein